jgi:hypothetical protein
MSSTLHSLATQPAPTNFTCPHCDENDGWYGYRTCFHNYQWTIGPSGRVIVNGECQDDHDADGEITYQCTNCHREMPYEMYQRLPEGHGNT